MIIHKEKSQEMKSSNSFESVIKKLTLKSINFELIEHKPVFTINDVLNTLNIKPEQTGKTILLSVKDCGLVAVVIPGYSKLDFVKIAKIIGKPRNDIKFAKAEEIEKIGLQIGAISPFLEVFTEVVVDESLLLQDKIYCGSGDLVKTIVVSVRDLVEVTSAKTADVIK